MDDHVEIKLEQGDPRRNSVKINGQEVGSVYSVGVAHVMGKRPTVMLMLSPKTVHLIGDVEAGGVRILEPDAAE